MSSPDTKPKFTADMIVGDAMELHPEAPLVFASYHLGGCAHCGVNRMETIEDVCRSYDIPVEQLVDSLNNLLDN